MFLTICLAVNVVLGLSNLGSWYAYVNLSVALMLAIIKLLDNYYSRERRTNGID